MKLHNTDTTDTKKEFWKSLKEYYDDPEVLKAKVNEFADGVTDEFNPDEMNKVSRRRFIALVSASAAFAATACTDYQDKGEIIAYTDRPEGVLPGKPNFYASNVNGKSVLVRVREGRPINIEGNPEHPIYKGKIDAQTPATLLNLYDPERLKDPSKNKRRTDWKNIDAEIIDNLKAAVEAGKEVALVTERISSPMTLNIINDFIAKYPTTKWYSYETVGDEHKRKAWNKTYGSRNIPSINLDKAKIIVSLESDFLGREGNTIENSLKFSKTRDLNAENGFGRLYSVEGSMSLTGMKADYRMRLRPNMQYQFVLSLINELGVKKRLGNTSLPADAAKYSLTQFADSNGLDKIKLGYLVDDLIQNQGKAILIGGDSLPNETLSAINILNEIISASELYDYSSAHLDHHALTPLAEIKENLIEDMNSGKVAVAINFSANPAYNLPSSLGFAEAWSKVPTTVSIVKSDNETSAVSNFVLPANHELESWGDNYSRSNVYELRQPVIAPIFNTRQAENILLTWNNGIADAFSEEAIHRYLMDVCKKEVYDKQNPAADFQSYWYNVLHDGFIEINNELPKQTPNASEVKDPGLSADGYVIHLQNSYYVADGKLTNNGWLQEIPHPVSKISWDNYAAVSPATAKELGVENNDLIKIDVNGNTLEIPAFIQPGMSEKTVNIEFGYGRTVIGDVGKESGFNCSSLQSEIGEFVITGASVTKSSGTYKLVSSQEHHALDDDFVKDFHKKRKIIQEGTLKEYEENPNFMDKYKYDNLKGITREHPYEGVKWGMSIDLNKCTSCGSCVTSCNVENNVPVVGKDQVDRGREMHWMRLDRYYSGTPEEPEVSNQPMLCQHCDNAPCENVCPVNATNHSPDGLNQMAYNRCVGTRYCANNCPYKVRRFNFYNFRDHFADAYYDNELSYLANNPEVTIRSRGVMEKCTFCVQRISEARELAIREGREVKGSDVITACQSACPSEAIVFGDVNDKDSEVAKKIDHDLAYSVLELLYVKPNVTYLAKLKNTHSEDS
jgi:MoCo/4Fe-4S cofactor protein with predicted Tat translocation signal